MRLIDGDTLYEQTAEWEARALHAVEKTMNDEDKTEWQKWSTILAERSAFKFDVADAPTVDAVPVVRCSVCKHFKPFRQHDGFCSIDGMLWDNNHYCSCGERKGGDE